MTEIASIPGATARQYRDQAIRNAETIYTSEVQNAESLKQKSIIDATAARDDVVREARETLESYKKRAAEASNKIDKKLSADEAKAERVIQEQRIIKAADDRVRTILKAGETYKRQVAAAEENRKRAILQAHEDEKQMKLKEKEAAKIQKETSRPSSGSERKANISADNTAAVKNKLQRSESAVEAQNKPGRDAKSEKHGTTTLKEIKPVQKSVDEDTRKDQERQAKDIKAKREDKSVHFKRDGNIKLVISNDSSDATHINSFVKSLSEISGIKIVMVSGDIQGGTQVVITWESSADLSEKLMQLSIVKEVVERHSDIMITLSPLVVFKNI